MHIFADQPDGGDGASTQQPLDLAQRFEWRLGVVAIDWVKRIVGINFVNLQVVVRVDAIEGLPLKCASVVRDGAWHGDAMEGTNQEGHGSLAGRRILCELSRKAQD